LSDTEFGSFLESVRKVYLTDGRISADDFVAIDAVLDRFRVYSREWHGVIWFAWKRRTDRSFRDSFWFGGEGDWVWEYRRHSKFNACFRLHDTFELVSIEGKRVWEFPGAAVREAIESRNWLSYVEELPSAFDVP